MSQLSRMSCIVRSFDSHSFISASYGLMNGEPFIVCALMMWSSNNCCMSSIADSIEMPCNIQQVTSTAWGGGRTGHIHCLVWRSHKFVWEQEGSLGLLLPCPLLAMYRIHFMMSQSDTYDNKKVHNKVRQMNTNTKINYDDRSNMDNT